MTTFDGWCRLVALLGCLFLGGEAVRFAQNFAAQARDFQPALVVQAGPEVGRGFHLAASP